MLTCSDMPAVRNLSASNAVPATPPPREVFSTSSPAATILCPNRLEEMQDFASFFTGGNTSSVLPFETRNKSAGATTSSNEASDTRRPLSLSSDQSTNPSFEGSPSAQDSANSPLVQQNFDIRVGGDTNGDGFGTSGSCSSNDGPSSSSSITRSMETLHDISDKQTAIGNYSNWGGHLPQGFHGWQPQGFHGWQPQGFHGWQPQSFHGWQPQGFHGWVDQGDRQRRQGDNSRMVNYGSKHYEHHDRYDWKNSYGSMCIRDPQFQLGHPRPPAILPQMPATMPIFAPPPPLQCNYGPVPNPGFPPQMYISPTNPHPDLSGGHPFVVPPAPVPAPLSMPFSLEGNKRALIMKQIEFYFSSENLRTDFYLKLHMDNYGWVSIHLIAGFRRIKRLTDNISFILEALIPSVVVEVERNRVRKRFGWNDWVRKSPSSQNSTDSENKS